MNRTDRLLAIILELQRHKRRRAEDLAATFEVSKRTIYRDIQALSESGVPIVSEMGLGYALVEGYFLPPVSLTVDEAYMLMLGSAFTAQNFDAQYRAAAQSAQRKIAAIMTEQQREEVNYLQTNIRFLWESTLDSAQEQDDLRQLRRAVMERKTVHLTYHKRYDSEDDDTLSVREVDPYGLHHHGGAWYLVGYCHLRQDLRYFRLSRIAQFTLLNKTFTRLTNPTFQPIPNERHLEIKVLFDNEASSWLRETHSFYIVAEQPHPMGCLVTLRVRHESDVLAWLLGWGRHIRVLEPPSMRRRLAEEAQHLFRNHQNFAKTE